MTDLPIVICDTESTGLDPTCHRLIEVSYARVDKGDWDAFHIDTYRFTPSRADYLAGHDRAYAVNGYRPNHPDWKDAPMLDTDEATVNWMKIRDDLTDVILMNQSVSFDAKFIMSELRRHAKRVILDPPWRDFTWEVGGFCRQFMKEAGKKGWKLHDTYDLLEGPWLPPHRAEADVLRALWVLAIGVQKFPKVWPDYSLDTDGAKEAVVRWSKKRKEVLAL